MGSQDNTVAAVPAESQPTIATEVNDSLSVTEQTTTGTRLTLESPQPVADNSTKEKAIPATGNTNAIPIPAQDDSNAASSSVVNTATDTTDNAVVIDQANDGSKEVDDGGPSLVITLLLITGARHPFRIDSKYLRKRGISVNNHDPFNMSVYTLKELIWREWRSDWEPRPSSPSAIRLISFGKLLDDKSPLSDVKFGHDAPNVVHMTVKPQEVVDEEDGKATKSYPTRDRDTNEGTPRCHCVIL